jgi:HlyD family secretion protein
MIRLLQIKRSLRLGTARKLLGFSAELLKVRVLLVLLTAAIAAQFCTGCGGGLPVEVIKVRRGAIREFVDEQAKTRVPNEFEVTMPYAARIQEIELQEGDRVSKGQVVAQIVSADVQNELAEAQAAVQRLDASIAENNDKSVEQGAYKQALQFVASMTATVAAAEERKKSGQKALEVAEANLGRVRKLYEAERANTREQLDQAELRDVESQVNYRTDVLVAESIKAIEAATLLMPQMVSDYISRKDLTGAVLEKQKAEAEARLRQAMVRQERSTMKSPIDGVVLARLESDEQFVQAGTTLLRIGDLSQLEVEVDVLSQDVIRVQVGDEAEIYGPSVGGGIGSGVAGTVARVYPAGFMKLSSLGVEQQRVKVIVRFEEGALKPLLERGLGVDYRVRARIYTDAKADALIVRRSALFRGADGGWQLYTVSGAGGGFRRGSAAKLTSVQVGLMNDDLVEIAEGLSPEDTVVLAPENSLTDGTGVRPIQR